MFYQHHISKHLFDIYSRKANGNAVTLLGLILGHGLIFRTLTALMSSESDKDSVFVI